MLCCEPGWFLYSSLTAFALFAHSTCVVARSNQGCRRERTKELVGDGMDALRAGRYDRFDLRDAPGVVCFSFTAARPFYSCHYFAS
jgi:hypothetical protein